VQALQFFGVLFGSVGVAWVVLLSGLLGVWVRSCGISCGLLDPARERKGAPSFDGRLSVASPPS